MSNVIYEDKEICKECGGFCCKKSGCDYSVDDFNNLNVNSIIKILEGGYVSIVSFQNFRRINGRMTNTPFLYLRARNVNRPAVDLLSMKTRCSALTDTGCMYTLEDRPSGGVNLIPCRDEACHPDKNPMDIVMGWSKYQSDLRKVVKRVTGKSVEEQMKEDAYKLFCDIVNKRFDGVMKMEIQDVLGMLPMLVEVYPNEFERSKKSIPCILNYKRSN